MHAFTLYHLSPTLANHKHSQSRNIIGHLCTHSSSHNTIGQCLLYNMSHTAVSLVLYAVDKGLCGRNVLQSLLLILLHICSRLVRLILWTVESKVKLMLWPSVSVHWCMCMCVWVFTFIPFSAVPWQHPQSAMYTVQYLRIYMLLLHYTILYEVEANDTELWSTITSCAELVLLFDPCMLTRGCIYAYHTTLVLCVVL